MRQAPVDAEVDVSPRFASCCKPTQVCPAETRNEHILGALVDVTSRPAASSCHLALWLAP
jgi:hypothetical protein